MKHTKSLILLFLSIFISAQLLQAQQLRSPVIQVKELKGEEKPVRISDVKIDVKVVGPLAVTTVDLTIYNPNSRILEGELQFPLADGQSVSRFALDINGNMREGVVVEKAKGQEVFESTIRQQIDPGLLEKTHGNNFRTRVYPLPAKGSRRVIIAYEQELPRENDGYRFFLPVEYGDDLDNFKVDLIVHSQEHKPNVDSTPWGTFAFNKAGEAFKASYSAKNYKAKGQLVFTVPSYQEKISYIEKGKIGNEVVFFAQVFPKLQAEKDKQKPKKIALVWDASASMYSRSLDLEMNLLDKYFQNLNDVEVDLYTFNCLMGKSQSFTINNGRWNHLKEALNKIAYDGATQLGMLDFKKLKVDEILLFTDGLTNFGKQIPIVGKTPVVAINSSLKADYNMLKYISALSGGTYVNLMQQKPEDAITMLRNESFRLVSIDYNEDEVKELTTSSSIVNQKEGFSIAGKLLKNKAVVTLNFGIGTAILYSETLTFNNKEAKDYDNIVERIWAGKRISELDMLYEKNKEEIEAIGRKYNIVTRNTSLIVLDNVEDYVRHKITPPVELLDEYNRIVELQRGEELESREDRIEDVVSMLEDRMEWWNKSFPKGKPRPPKPPKPPKQTQTNRSSRSSSGGNSRVESQSSTHNGQTVTGIVKDSAGEPIIGCTVKVKGTTNGTITDLDGKYTVNAAPGDVLIFAFVGMNSLEVNAIGSQLDVVLEDAAQYLEEVVVTAYSAQRRQSYTGSVSTIRSAPVADALQGRVAGVSVNQAQNEENAEIRIRGAASVFPGDNPVYVVDGQVVENLEDIDADEVESMSVLKDAAATSIYGARAANGVVIVTTKTGNTSAADVISSVRAIKEGEIALREWTPDAPYMDSLKNIANDKLYNVYLSIREEYKDTPSFFLDVATLFEQRGLKEESLVILSNLVEMNLENYRLTRVLAHRLGQLGYNEYAIGQFEAVLKLRPEEPQSYRDLGLIYAQNKEYQKAIDMFYRIILGDWDGRFEEIELFAVEEMNNAIFKAKKAKEKLNLSDVDKRLICDMPVDIRIVLNWDTDNSDMDLWVTDPYGEKCYYSNNLTRIGGMISDDFTDGYGPEVFLIKEAVRGKYKIQANYYNSREQTLIGPTTIYLELYTNYSTAKETRKTITLRLTEDGDVVDIGEVTF
jgi:TonB-dependent SusC/RagA subfamily outer membrane receptor